MDFRDLRILRRRTERCCCDVRVCPEEKFVYRLFIALAVITAGNSDQQLPISESSDTAARIQLFAS